MGFLDFLKKDKEDTTQATPPVSQQPINSKEDGDIKIPLPDEAPMIKDDLSDLEPKTNGLDVASVPPTDLLNNQEIKERPLAEQPKREMPDTNNSVTNEEPPQENLTNNTIVAESPKTDETTDPSDFSLPDFSDEDLKIGSLNEDLNQEKKEEDLPKMDEKKEINVIPPLKTPSENTNLSSNNYLEMNNCKKIFENIYQIQKTIESSKDSVQKQDALNKNELQQYKNIHDDLDIVQEKLMEIDGTLFEG